MSLASKNRIIGNAAKSQVSYFETLQPMTHLEIVVLLTLSCWLARAEISLFSKIQIITNFKNTVHGFKKFHGRAFDDPFVHAEKPKLPYSLHKLANGNTGIKVRHCGNVQRALTPSTACRRRSQILSKALCWPPQALGPCSNLLLPGIS